jgi:Fe-S cluster biogenesis protein NfuA
MVDKEVVESIIEKRIRPYLKLHGGDIKLASVEEEKVKVELKGSCEGCPMAQITLKDLVNRILKSELPSIKEVENIIET